MSGADLIVGLTSKSMAHSKARQRATDGGARYLSLPDYSMDFLASPALQVNFRSLYPTVRMVADWFTGGREAEVSTRAGTNVRLNILGREGNCCPGYVERPGDLGSPPDVEANVSPIETDSEGFLVVDGSIPHPDLGLLNAAVELKIANGCITDILGPSDVVSILESLFSQAGSPKAKILAECGVGLNRAAQLTGNMLTDEGAAGSMHFGFGSNSTVGGLNDIGFHLDFVFRAATLKIDGRTLIRDGELVG